MAEFTVQALTTLGLVSSYTAAAGAGDEFINDGFTFLHAKNGSGAAITITITSQVSPIPKGLAAADIALEVTAAGEKMAGFFDQGAYNDSSGKAQLTYSDVTNLTIAAISVT